MVSGGSKFMIFSRFTVNSATKVTQYYHQGITRAQYLPNNIVARTVISNIFAQILVRPFSDFGRAPSTMTMVEAAYGTWKSPISSQLATESSVSFQELHVDRKDHSGTVYWTELRVGEGGRYVICSSNTPGGDAVTWTASEFSARTLVHEYGGGACLVHNGKVYFSNYKNQRMYVQEAPGKVPTAISPEGLGYRYADASFSDKLNKIYVVREDHGVIDRKEAKEAKNTIVVIDPYTQQQTLLVSSADFYSSPKVSPDGKKIAWIQWMHPNMPWDTTELWLAELDPTGDAILPNSQKRIAGGDNTSVLEPQWTPDNQLLYIGDQTDWWNLYLVTPSGEHTNLHPVDKEIGGPHWVFAHYHYDIDPNGSGLVATSYGGVFGILDLKDGSYKEYDTGYSTHNCIQFCGDGNIYCTAGSPTSFSAIIQVNPKSGQVETVKKSRSLAVGEGYLSIPQTITWNTQDGALSHGFYYPPKNQDYMGMKGTLPPLLVKAHGGPTSQASDTLNLKIQYFTSRGFGVLDVNYRGSTGYGKSYRHSLRKNWGIYDVEDCCSGALYLAEKKLVDVNCLCIDGGSAGGYTTLACLAFRNVFKAGASHYGICDVEVLMQDTHKFESRYTDTLIAPYTEEYKPQIHARSPIKHIDEFSCPVVFFQGDEDKIVPPNQSKMMFDAVKAKGIPCAYVLFEGEQHGFRKAENIQMALDGEFYFYGKVFGFEPADNKGQLEITNLS